MGGLPREGGLKVLGLSDPNLRMFSFVCWLACCAVAGTGGSASMGLRCPSGAA